MTAAKIALGSAITVLCLLVFAQIVRSRDITTMRERTVINCQKIEVLKVFIVATVNASSGLTEADKVKARAMFAPKSC